MPGSIIRYSEMKVHPLAKINWEGDVGATLIFV